MPRGLWFRGAQLLLGTIVVGCASPETSETALSGSSSTSRVLSSELVGGSEEAWSGISGVAALADTGFVFADVGQGALVVVNARGDVTRRIGRRGSGPGEYQYIQWFGACPDSTLVAYDPAANSLTVLGKDLVTTRTVQVPGEVRRQDAVGCTDRSKIVFLVETGTIAAYGSQRWPAIAISFDLETLALDTIAHLPGRDVFVSERHSATIPVPLGLRTLLSTGLQSLVSATNTGDTVHWYEGSGATSVHLEGLPVVPIALLKRSVATQIVAMYPEKRDQKAARDVIREAGVGRTGVRIGALLAQGDESVWILVPDSSTAVRTWIRYERQGRARQRVVLPAEFAPMLATRQRLIGVLRDSLGVEWPAAFRVDQPIEQNKY